MNRNIFCVALSAMLLALSFSVQAQQQKKVYVIGVLILGNSSSVETNLKPLRQRLQELGYVEGKNIVFEYRSGEGNIDRLRALAAELARLKVDVILVTNTPAAMAAKSATTTVPIVVTNLSDPVATGLVSSLARPGGNVTGVTIMNVEIAGKRVE